MLYVGLFVGLMFLVCYLLGKIKVFDSSGYVVKLCFVFLLMFVVVFIGMLCVDDYWYYWIDVFVGVIIGMFFVFLFYFYFFFYLYDDNGNEFFVIMLFFLWIGVNDYNDFMKLMGWVLYVYFSMLVESSCCDMMMIWSSLWEMLENDVEFGFIFMLYYCNWGSIDFEW